MTPWGRSIEDTWEDCATRDFVAGTFLWTGLDYRGETYPFSWPAVITRYGLMDLCGFPKDSYYYYQAEWTDTPVLHLFPHWNLEREAGAIIDLWCYTNCAEVELYLNGESQGRLKRAPYRKLQWDVPYTQGTLEAVGYDSAGQEIVRTSIETTGPATNLRIINAHSNTEADGSSVVILNVSACDEAGRNVPTADAMVDFEICGAATLLGVGNGNPTSHEAEQAPRRQLFNGRAQLIIRAHNQAGAVSIRAHADDLESGMLRIETSQTMTATASIGASTVQSSDVKKLNPIDGSL